MNNEWQTGTPPNYGRYLVSIFNFESGDHFHSTSLYLGEWPAKNPYMITGWIPLPDLPEAPKDLPQVEKITWYPFRILPEKKGTYLVKRPASDGVAIYDSLLYDGKWPDNDFTFWAKQD